jgi:hypothetical protein
MTMTYGLENGRLGGEGGGTQEALNNGSCHATCEDWGDCHGLKSVGCEGVKTLATDRIKACFHCSGTLEVGRERLSDWFVEERSAILTYKEPVFDHDRWMSHQLLSTEYDQ